MDHLVHSASSYETSPFQAAYRITSDPSAVDSDEDAGLGYAVATTPAAAPSSSSSRRRPSLPNFLEHPAASLRSVLPGGSNRNQQQQDNSIQQQDQKSSKDKALVESSSSTPRLTGKKSISRLIRKATGNATPSQTSSDPVEESIASGAPSHAASSGQPASSSSSVYSMPAVTGQRSRSRSSSSASSSFDYAPIRRPSQTASPKIRLHSIGDDAEEDVVAAAAAFARPRARSTATSSRTDASLTSNLSQAGNGDGEEDGGRARSASDEVQEYLGEPEMISDDVGGDSMLPSRLRSASQSRNSPRPPIALNDAVSSNSTASLHRLQAQRSISSLSAGSWSSGGPTPGAIPSPKRSPFDLPPNESSSTNQMLAQAAFNRDRSNSFASSVGGRTSVSSTTGPVTLLPEDGLMAEQYKTIIRHAEQFSRDDGVVTAEDGSQMTLASQLAAYGEALQSSRNRLRRTSAAQAAVYNHNSSSSSGSIAGPPNHVLSELGHQSSREFVVAGSSRGLPSVSEHRRSGSTSPALIKSSQPESKAPDQSRPDTANGRLRAASDQSRAAHPHRSPSEPEIVYPTSAMAGRSSRAKLGTSRSRPASSDGAPSRFAQDNRLGSKLRTEGATSGNSQLRANSTSGLGNNGLHVHFTTAPPSTTTTAASSTDSAATASTARGRSSSDLLASPVTPPMSTFGMEPLTGALDSGVDAKEGNQGTAGGQVSPMSTPSRRPAQTSPARQAENMLSAQRGDAINRTSFQEKTRGPPQFLSSPFRSRLLSGQKEPMSSSTSSTGHQDRAGSPAPSNNGTAAPAMTASNSSSSGLMSLGDKGRRKMKNLLGGGGGGGK